MSTEEKEVKKKKPIGRPKKNIPDEESMVDEKSIDRLDMEKKENIDIEEITKKWQSTFDKIAEVSASQNVSTTVAKWNKLNPFLQNERIKQIYSQARTYGKKDISDFLLDPGHHEVELRGLGWANSSSQQIYYNILRRSSDVPNYNWYVIPPEFEKDSEYKENSFITEDQLVDSWLKKFNIPNTFKTIALEVKREGKSSYLLRNKFNGEGKNRKPGFCTLQKLPTEWTKITGKGQLGFTVSFNMLYFLNIANSPADFGEFFIQAWDDMHNSELITVNKDGNKVFNPDKAQNYKFKYEGNEYGSTLEIVKQRGSRIPNYLFWIRLPFDICYTFGSDNSHPWVAPDTMGLMLKLQELTDYGQLAGLIASTPLTAVLTGEIETIPNPRAGKNESVFSPEVIKGYMTQFNQATSTNVEAWMWPAKNIKLQQLSADVNSSDILSEATENFIASAGEGGLTIVTEKPNVAQINVAKLLAASQQRYVTLQFENVMNFILQYKLGFNYHWQVSIWGDIFTEENHKKYLKEVVASGNIALFPKLMSAEGISLRDTRAVTKYIKSLEFYDDFMTYTLLKNAELKEKQSEEEVDEEGNPVGRPSLDDGDVDNDDTAASKASGLNTSDNRE